KQHLELARDIAAKFNLDTGTETFAMPEPMIAAAAPRVMSLRDGSAKMSKSDPSDMSRINLLDDDDAIAQKLRKARTDADPLPDTVDALAGRAEALNLVTIYAALAGENRDAVCQQFAGQGFGTFKSALADCAIARIAPIRARFAELMTDTAAIDAILIDGAARARAIAAPTLNAAQTALGLHHR
nr:tryptophan--tRNA ligase [Sphingopyxis sp.]